LWLVYRSFAYSAFAVKRLLIASIELARQVNPDRLTNPAQSLEQYYDFVSWAERAIPGSLLKEKADATLYQRIDQSLSYLYFIVDQPLNELEWRGYFNNSPQYVEPYSSWLKTFVRSWGAFHAPLSHARPAYLIAMPRSLLYSSS
jgi:phosphatidylserine decarboxylase